VPHGQRIALELAARSDVVLENFRPGVTDRLGLGYEHVRQRNPGVVYCSITGYGRDGPESGRRAYAPVMHAELGLMEFTARMHGIEPLAEAVSHADLYSGLQAVIGILAALHHRQRTGEGQHVEVSMAEVMLQASEWTAIEVDGDEGERLHSFGGFHAPVLRLGDGSTVCVPGDPVGTFPAWCAAMGREDLLQDARFSTREARSANRTAMVELLRNFAAGFGSFADFETAIGKARMAAGAVRSIADAVDSPWGKEREVLVDVGDDSTGAMRLPRSPFRFSTLDAGTSGRPVHQGAHNREVLRDVLGMDDEEIARLERDGVLFSRPADA